MARIWPQFPPEIADRIASSLTPNDIACTLRVLNRAAAKQFCAPGQKVVRLSQPVPSDAFAKRWCVPGAMDGLTLHQRRELLCLTAASGVVRNLELALTHAGCSPTAEVFAAAASTGQKAACECLLRWGCPKDNTVLAAAAAADHVETYAWLLDRGFVWDTAAVCAAARCGHLGAANTWLAQQELDSADASMTVTRVLEAIASGCNLTVLLRWHFKLVGTRVVRLAAQNRESILAAAAGSPSPDWQAKVEMLERFGFARSEGAACAAAFRPDALERLRWLRQRGYPLTSLAAVAAGDTGNLQALEFLRSERVDVRPAAAAAACAGHLPVLRAVVAWVPVSSPAVLSAAVAGGQLEVVAWLVEGPGRTGPIEPDGGLLCAAAKLGSVELMAWLHERGAPLAERAFAEAAAAGKVAALEWLAARGCLMPVTGEPLVLPCHAGDLATLRCLKRLGCPWGSLGSSLITAAVRNMPILRWLLQEGCPVDWGAMEAAADCTSPEARALLEECRQRRRQEGWDDAAECGAEEGVRHAQGGTWDD